MRRFEAVPSDVLYAAGAAVLCWLVWLCLVVALVSCAPRYVAKPLEVVRPCLSAAPPVRSIIQMFGPARVVKFTDADGESHEGVSILADPPSLRAFFSYVEALEEIAKAAVGCKQ